MVGGSSESHYEEAINKREQMLIEAYKRTGSRAKANQAVKSIIESDDIESAFHVLWVRHGQSGSNILDTGGRGMFIHPFLTYLPLGYGCYDAYMIGRNMVTAFRESKCEKIQVISSVLPRAMQTAKLISQGLIDVGLGATLTGDIICLNGISETPVVAGLGQQNMYKAHWPKFKNYLNMTEVGLPISDMVQGAAAEKEAGRFLPLARAGPYYLADKDSLKSAFRIIEDLSDNGNTMVVVVSHGDKLRGGIFNAGILAKGFPIEKTTRELVPSVAERPLKVNLLHNINNQLERILGEDMTDTNTENLHIAYMHTLFMSSKADSKFCKAVNGMKGSGPQEVERWVGIRDDWKGRYQAIMEGYGYGKGARKVDNHNTNNCFSGLIKYNLEERPGGADPSSNEWCFDNAKVINYYNSTPPPTTLVEETPALQTALFGYFPPNKSDFWNDSKNIGHIFTKMLECPATTDKNPYDFIFDLHKVYESVRRNEHDKGAVTDLFEGAAAAAAAAAAPAAASTHTGPPPRPPPPRRSVGQTLTRDQATAYGFSENLINRSINKTYVLVNKEGKPYELRKSNKVDDKYAVSPLWAYDPDNICGTCGLPTESTLVGKTRSHCRICGVYIHDNRDCSVSKYCKKCSANLDTTTDGGVLRTLRGPVLVKITDPSQTSWPSHVSVSTTPPLRSADLAPETASDPRRKGRVRSV